MSKYNVFGSSDSRDLDVVALVPTDVDALSLKSHELERLEKQIGQEIALSRDDTNQLPVDVTLISLDSEGHVCWTSKGTPTKTNNVVFTTYSLHKQVHPCLVSSLVRRRISDEFAQMCGTVQRSVTNAYYHQLPFLADRDWLGRQLAKLAVTVISLPIVRGAQIEHPFKRCKALAFQVALTHSLLLKSREIFTKSDIFEQYPDLKPFFLDEPPLPDSAFECLNRLLQEVVVWASDHQVELKADRHPELHFSF